MQGHIVIPSLSGFTWSVRCIHVYSTCLLFGYAGEIALKALARGCRHPLAAASPLTIELKHSMNVMDA